MDKNRKFKIKNPTSTALTNLDLYFLGMGLNFILHAYPVKGTQTIPPCIFITNKETNTHQVLCQYNISDPRVWTRLGRVDGGEPVHCGLPVGGGRRPLG